MSNGKHNNSSRKTTNTDKKISFIKFFLIILIICFIIFLIIYNKKNENNNSSELHNDSTTYKHSEIDLSRYVVGLDSAKIIDVNLNSSSSASIIDVHIKNTSDTSIGPCELLFYLLNDSKERIFGTNINVPGINPDEEKTFQIFCTDDVSATTDYEILLKEE